MIPRLILASVGAVFGAIAGAVCLVLLYTLAPGITLDMTHGPTRLLEGFYAGERAGDLTFAWTRARGDVTLPGLDRSVPWKATVRLRAARPPGQHFPDVTLLVDGVPFTTIRGSNEFAEITATIPARQGRTRGLVVSIASSNVFQPGPQDKRELGLQVDQVRVAPAEGWVVPPNQGIVVAAVASAVFGAAFGILGATAGSVIGAAALLALAQAAAMRFGLGLFSPWMDGLPWMAFGIAGVMLLIVTVIEQARGKGLRNTARFAVMFSAAALYLKLIVLLHPHKPLVDAQFHAHRLMTVLAGNLFFTSTAPGGYQFPYPVALYVFTSPFTRLTSDYVTLLRIVTASAEAVSAALLYWVVARFWRDRLVASASVALMQLMPFGFSVLAAANLTNAFGQAVSVAAFVTLGMLAAPKPWPWRGLLGVAVVSIAFVAHTSTFATLAGAVAASAGFLLVPRPATESRQELRRAGTAALVVLTISMTLAVSLYYRHFGDTYRTERTRISAGMAGGNTGERVRHPSGRNTVTERLRAIPSQAEDAYTLPVLLLASLGVLVAAERPRDVLKQLIAGWVIAGVAFVTLGVLTPVDMRSLYATMPAVAILAGVGFAWGWRRGRLWRVASTALVVWLAVIAVRGWLRVLV